MDCNYNSLAYIKYKLPKNSHSSLSAHRFNRNSLKLQCVTSHDVEWFENRANSTWKFFILPYLSYWKNKIIIW